MSAPATLPRIEPASADDAAAVLAGLRAFNRAACGQALDDQSLNRVIRDAQGQPCAGLVADVYGGWLVVHALWVDTHQRGRRLGQALLADAERQALAMGARSAQLDTFSWQAEGFYLKQGYEVFGRLADFPPGHGRSYLRKRLAAA